MWVSVGVKGKQKLFSCLVLGTSVCNFCLNVQLLFGVLYGGGAEGSLGVILAHRAVKFASK